MARYVASMSFGSPIISIAWSPDGEFLATAHSDSAGVTLWSSTIKFYGTDVPAQARHATPAIPA